MSSAWDIQGEKTNQISSVTPTTGAKYFGTSLAPSAGNPNLTGKYSTLYIVGGLTICAVAFFYFKGRK